jgi:hypothetical protein
MSARLVVLLAGLSLMMILCAAILVEQASVATASHSLDEFSALSGR